MRSLDENVGAATTATAANLGAAFTATDADSGDTLTYSLEDTDAGAFTVNSNTGQLRTKVGETYDHESQPSYAMNVKVDDGNGGSDRIVVIVSVTDVDEPPLAPAAPTVSSDSTTSLTVVWSAPSNTGRPAITSYDLQYRQGTSGPWTDGPQNLTVTSATISSLAVGTAYQVQVRARNAEGDSPWSSPGSGSTNVVDNNAPTFDAGSSAFRNVDENTASGQDIGSPVSATDTDNDPLTYALTGTDARAFSIDTGTGQLRTRAALNHEAKDSYSVTITVSDGRGGTDSIAVTIDVDAVDEKPLAPRAPRVTPVAGDDMSLQVTWSAPANTGPEIIDYDLRYRKGDGEPWRDGPQNVTGTSATITGLNPDTLSEVQVQVRARNAEGEGEWSLSGTELKVSAPRAPARVTVKAGDGQLTVNWWAASGATAYTVQWKSGSEEYGGSRQRSVATSSATISGLTNGTPYTVRVAASNEGGSSGWSAEATGTPQAPPGVPTQITVTPGDRSLLVRWSAVPETTRYTLQWKTESEEYRSRRQRTIETPYAAIGHLDNGTPYTLRVRASNAGGDSAWSAEATGTPESESGPEPVPALPGAGVLGLGLLLLGAARRVLRSRGGV